MKVRSAQGRQSPAHGGAGKSIAAQHHELREALEVIERTADPASLLPLLRDLRTDLAAHFADEEQDDGLAAAIGSSAPRHLRRLGSLFLEHRDLMDALDQLIARGQSLLDGPLAEVLGETQGLTARLRQHEAAETELLADAVYSDLGGGS